MSDDKKNSDKVEPENSGSNKPISPSDIMTEQALNRPPIASDKEIAIDLLEEMKKVKQQP